jgi:succinoglycan biosynthesis protein ExoM
MNRRKAISVCVCTYRRTDLLERLLVHVEEQITNQSFDYSIVIVDNDRQESARDLVCSFAKRSARPVAYHVEPEQNIALARNKAIENTHGDFVAFIDDDEYPDKDWLLRLYDTYHQHEGVRGVLGPINPYFEINPPRWIVKGKFFHRDSFPTGTIIRNARYLRTGNVLLSRTIFADSANYFDRRFGKSGGEDGDFFRRMLRQDMCFVWCNEAGVNELVPQQRLKRSYLLKRAILQGSAYARAKKVTFCSRDAFKSMMAVLLYTIPLPLLLLSRHDLFMKCLTKDGYHFSKILTTCGIQLVKERSI